MGVLTLRRLSALALGAVLGGPGLMTTSRATPVTYDIRAQTFSGLGGAAAGDSLSSGDLMRLLTGGKPRSTRSLQLTLWASGEPPTSPQAEHRIPPGLGLGLSLPLVTQPLVERVPTFADPGDAPLPSGRLLMFQGCMEDGGSPASDVLEIAQLLPDQRAIARALARSERVQMPEDPERSGVRVEGRWPDRSPSPPVAAEASLVGTHRVISNYAPEIVFDVEQTHDFLEPVALQTTRVEGSWRLNWQTIPTVSGYQALVAGPGLREGDVVIWSSSELAQGESSMLGAFSGTTATGPGLMGPERTSCMIPAVAMQQIQAGVLHFAAVGDPLQLRAPGPDPAWQLTLHRQATVIQPLAEGLWSGPSQEAPYKDPSRPKPSTPFNLFRGLF